MEEPTTSPEAILIRTPGKDEYTAWGVPVDLRKLTNESTREAEMARVIGLVKATPAAFDGTPTSPALTNWMMATQRSVTTYVDANGVDRYGQPPADLDA